MDIFDAPTLARFQFALTICFHYLFPPLSIGLGVLMVIMEGLYLKTGNRVYENMARFWTRIFAATFAVGVASGIVMEFQFGTNWAAYSRFVGDVFGSALAAEGIFAFFLESGFLAVLVFGWDRVSPRVHFFSTLMVCLGSIFSAVWIVVANSWMQTPAGYHIVNGRAEITDYWAVVFNPSSVNRLTHTVLGALITGAFFVLSVSSYYLLKNRFTDFAIRSFKIALVVATAAALLQLLSGDRHAVQVAKTQPAKLAAFEGLFETTKGPTPLNLIGWPSESERKTKFAIAVPGLLSFLVHRDFTTPVVGLDQIPRDEWPPIAVPFFAYHIMIACGMYSIGATLMALFLWWRGSLFRQRWLLWAFVFSIGVAYVANYAGWAAAEVGRQPWIVYKLMRTSDGISKSVRPAEIAASIAMFCFVYTLLFALWIFVLNNKIQHGPDDIAPPEKTTLDGLMDTASRLESEDDSMTSSKPTDRQAQ